MKSPETYETESGTLLEGVRIGGTFHKEFTLREEILSDNLGENAEVRENWGDEILKEESPEAISLLKNLVSFRRRIVKLGNLNEEELSKVTAKDLSTMKSVDYSTMLRAKLLLDAQIEAALLGKQAAAKKEDENSKKK